MPRVALLIERDTLTARRARRVLRRAGYHVERAADPALEHVTRARPDLVVVAMVTSDGTPDGGHGRHDVVAFVQDLRRISRVPLMIATPHTSDLTLSTWLDCARAVEEATGAPAAEEPATALDRALAALETVALDVALYWSSRFGRGDAVPTPVRARADGGEDTSGPSE